MKARHWDLRQERYGCGYIRPAAKRPMY